MRILEVCRGSRSSSSFNLARDKPYVYEQAESLRRRKHSVDVFPIFGSGAPAYARAVADIRRMTTQSNYDIVHAHFGVAGAAAVLGSRTPVVVTFHGSDINRRSLRPFSTIAARRAARTIYVSNHLLDLAWVKGKAVVVPCGVDLRLFAPVDRQAARLSLGLEQDKSIVVFGGRFTSIVKDGRLAATVAGAMKDVQVIELTGFSRSDVNLLLNAADALLLTSRTEGSPQIVKEALAVNCPVVSTDVGDVKDRLRGIDGCAIVGRDVLDVVAALRRSIAYGRVQGRASVVDLDLDEIAARLESIYVSVISSPARN